MGAYFFDTQEIQFPLENIKDYKHGYQLYSSMMIFGAATTILFFSSIITYFLSKSNDYRIFRYLLYYILLAVFTHFAVWWVFEPQCVGCIRQSDFYGLSFVGVFTPWVLIMIAIVVSIVLHFSKSKSPKLVEVRNEISRFVVVYLLLLPAVSIVLPFIFVMGPILLLDMMSTGHSFLEIIFFI